MAADRLLDRARRNSDVAHPSRRRPRHRRVTWPRHSPSGCCRHPARPPRTADRHQVRPAYKNSQLPTQQRVDDLLRRMTLAEKIGQMTQAERIDVDADPSLITTHALGSILSGGGSTPASNTPEAWADMVDRYQEAALETRLGIPHPVRRGHGPRPRQPAGRHGLPAQHRPGRHPRPGPGRGRRAHRGDRDPGERTAVGVRALRLRRPRRPVGPHLRELRRGPEAGHEAWRPRSTGSRATAAATWPGRTACWPPPSTSPATD